MRAPLRAIEPERWALPIGMRGEAFRASSRDSSVAGAVAPGAVGDAGTPGDAGAVGVGEPGAPGEAGLPLSDASICGGFGVAKRGSTKKFQASRTRSESAIAVKRLRLSSIRNSQSQVHLAL